MTKVKISEEIYWKLVNQAEETLPQWKIDLINDELLISKNCRKLKGRKRDNND